MSLALAPLSLALFALLPLQRNTQLPSARVAVARVRSEWYRALDRAGWDRDARSVVTAAQALAPPMLDLANADGPARSDAIEWLADAAPPGTEAVLRAQAPPDRRLLRGLLRRRTDPSLIADFVTSGAAMAPSVWDDVLDLARWHRGFVAAALARRASSLSGHEREELCVAALELPTGPRATVAFAVASALPEAPDVADLGPGCAALASLHRAGRARLAQWLSTRPADLDRGRAAQPWRLTALLGLAGTEQHAAAAQGVTQTLRRQDAPELLGSSAEAAAVLLALMPRPHALARSLLAQLDARNPHDPRWVIARLRAHDPAVGDGLLELLRNPHREAGRVIVDVNLAGLAAGHGPRASDLRARLVSLREQARAFGITRLSAPFLDAWIDAIERVARCRGRRTCLVELVRDGSDDDAARAMIALGPRGLASLAPATSRKLVRRLVIAPSTWLLLAFVLSVERCPDSLRGAREAVSARAADEFGSLAAPYVREFARRCEDGP